MRIKSGKTRYYANNTHSVQSKSAITHTIRILYAYNAPNAPPLAGRRNQYVHNTPLLRILEDATMYKARGEQYRMEMTGLLRNIRRNICYPPPTRRPSISSSAGPSVRRLLHDGTVQNRPRADIHYRQPTLQGLARGTGENHHFHRGFQRVN